MVPFAVVGGEGIVTLSRGIWHGLAVLVPGFSRIVAKLVERATLDVCKPRSDLHKLWWAILGSNRTKIVGLTCANRPLTCANVVFEVTLGAVKCLEMTP